MRHNCRLHTKMNLICGLYMLYDEEHQVPLHIHAYNLTNEMIEARREIEYWVRSVFTGHIYTEIEKEVNALVNAIQFCTKGRNYKKNMSFLSNLSHRRIMVRIKKCMRADVDMGRWLDPLSSVDSDLGVRRAILRTLNRK